MVHPWLPQEIAGHCSSFALHNAKGTMPGCRALLDESGHHLHATPLINQGGTKPATLETGAVINVPLFVNIGDKLKVDTREDRYIGRA